MVIIPSLFPLIFMIVIFVIVASNRRFGQTTRSKKSVSDKAQMPQKRKYDILTPKSEGSQSAVSTFLNQTYEADVDKKPSSKSTIIDKAKKNVSKYQADSTLSEMEETHAHSEKVKPTNVKKESAVLKAGHPHNAEHVDKLIKAEEKTNLKHIKDLIVMGYDGNLSFERDFVSEGQDMINQFLYRDVI